MFKYKLNNCFSFQNRYWSEEEVNCIQNYFDALLEYHFSHTKEMGSLLECVLILGMAPDKILSYWKSDGHLHFQQALGLHKHFRSKGCYIGDSQKVEKFIELFHAKLTPEELAEIFFD